MLVVHHAFIFLKYLMGARGLCHVCRDLQLEWPLLPLFPSTLTELDTDRRHTHSQLCAVSMQSNDNSNVITIVLTRMTFAFNSRRHDRYDWCVQCKEGVFYRKRILDQSTNVSLYFCATVDSWKTTRQSDTLWRHNQNNNLLTACWLLSNFDVRFI